MITPPKKPCGSCPYRRDVPSGIWSAEEYDKLPGYDGEMWMQPHLLFMCHQQDGCLCGGWLITHGVNNLLALRVHARELDPSVWSYVSDVKCFASGAEAAAMGKVDIDNPSPAACRMIGGLVRKDMRS